MKSVGIITYTNSPNYGAALQLYATYCAIRKIGFESIVVNYTNEFENNSTSPIYLLRKGEIKAFARILIAGYVFGSVKLGRKNFDTFYRDMNYSNRIKNVRELINLPIDVFCVGSDQVWNPCITGGYDDVFFVNESNIKKKISFSSSMGSDFDNLDDEYIRNALSVFSNVSVREIGAKRYLENIGVKNVGKVVDPTLLFGKNEWIELCQKSKYVVPADYLLIYAIGGEFGKLLDISRPIAKKYGLKIAAITLSTRRKRIDYIMNNVSPVDFPVLFREASFVVTNSFHGTCFSIINETPFISVKYRANPGRAVSLLNDCKLMHRLYSQGENDVDIDRLMNTDDIYNANKVLANLKEESFVWLEEALRNAVEKD